MSKIKMIITVFNMLVFAVGAIVKLNDMYQKRHLQAGAVMPDIIMFPRENGQAAPPQGANGGYARQQDNRRA